MQSKPKIFRACTVPASLGFVKGMIPDLVKKYDVSLLSSPGENWQIMEGYINTVNCHKISMSRHIDVINDIKALLKIWKLFRREKPTMVHSMTPKAGLLCMMAAWMARVPVRVHTFTGLVFPTATGLKRKILMATDRLTCACATHIIPEGEGVKKDLLNNRITRKPIKVLGYGNCQGIDLNHFNPNQEFKFLPEDPLLPAPKLHTIETRDEYSKNFGLKPTLRKNTVTFISIGRLVRDKGINELVLAYKRLHAEFPNTRLILLGHTESKLDPLAPDTLDIINADNSIEAAGFQNEIRPWLAVSDCSILASYREGFPNVVIEAGAMGLPQIVTDINGANEIIQEGKNGTIIPPRDSEALYQAMRRMVTDELWRKELASNARYMISSRFDQHFVRKCLYNFYDEILKGM